MRKLFVALGAMAGAGLLLQCSSIPDLCYGDECHVTDKMEAGACDPANAPANVSNYYGVFVNADVDAADSSEADGSKDKPFKTIAQALENRAGKSKVFLCASSGAYAEQVTLPANVSLYGGFECGTWNYNCGRPKVAPDGPGVALSIAGSSGVTIADMEFVANDASIAGDSSIAVFVANSEDVVFKRVTAIASTGALGLSPGLPPTNHARTDALAASDSDGTGGGPTTCTCTYGSNSIGGQGSKGGDPAAEGDIGACTPTVAAVGWGTGGSAYKPGPPPVACGVGNVGADASSSGGGGGGGATSYGTLDETGWHPTSGDKGTPGNPGQGGGGGGGGQSLTIGGGGSGGCGGCGGTGGLGGGGGGASVALASFQSTVSLYECTLSSSNGGAGGKGGQGEPGDPGLVGGRGVDGPGAGCNGGAGGNGAGGGGGGGGAGGISVGVLSSSGSGVTIDTTTINSITFGAAGKGGAAGPKGAGGNNGMTEAPSGEDGTAGVGGFSGPVYPPTP